MKNIKNFLLTILLSLVSTVSAFAYDFEVEGFYYNILSVHELTCEVTNSGNLDIWDYSSASYSGDVVIPSSVTYNGKTFSVTKIGNDAFNNCTSLTSIEFPNSVTSIGAQAFYYCPSLTSVVIPNSVISIGSDAFYYCEGLTYIEIPASVETMGLNPFRSCWKLSEIKVLGGNNFFVENNCLISKDGLLIKGANESSVIIPGSVTEIGEWSFSDYYNIKSVEIPNSVVSIGRFEFYYCKKLTSVEIPNSVTEMGDGVFYSCFRLKSIKIPNSVTEIKDNTFHRCTSLTSIEIEKSVNKFGKSVFGDCGNLKEIIVHNPTPAEVEDDTFSGVPKEECVLYVPKGKVQDYSSAQIWNEFKTIKEIDGSGSDDPEDYRIYDRNVVIEEGTGMWCGWCVRGIVAMEEMKEKYPDTFIGIAVHASDALAVKSYPANVNGYPGCNVNRRLWDQSVSSGLFEYYYKSERSLKTFADFSLQGLIVGNKIYATTEFNFDFNKEQADYRVVYVLKEDGVTGYYQNNAYAGGGNGEMGGFENKPNQITDIVFNDVARMIYPSYEGEQGSLPSNIIAGEFYENNEIMELPSTIQNRDMLTLIAMLIDGETGEIIQAHQIHLEEDPNGIFDVQTDENMDSDDLYNLQGQKVGSNYKGIVIKHGKKKLITNK